MRKSTAIVGVLLVGVLWGSAPTGTVIALDGLNVWDISFLRAVFASLVLLPFLRNLSFLKMSRDEFLKVFVLSFFGISLFWVFMTIGIEFSTPIQVSLLVNTSPLLVVLLAHTLLSESLTKARLFGVFLGLIGTYIVISGGQIFNLFSSETLFGDIFALATAGCWAIYMIVYRRYVNQMKLTHSQITANIFIIAIFTLLPAELASSSLNNILQAPIEALLATLWLGAVSSGLGFIVINRSLTVLKASVAAVNLMIVPLSAIIIANLILGEEITPYKAAGGLLIVLGIMISELIGRNRHK